jgi:hypothetical protein
MSLRDGHHVLELFDQPRPEREINSHRDTEILKPRTLSCASSRRLLLSRRLGGVGGWVSRPDGPTFTIIAVCPTRRGHPMTAFQTRLLNLAAGLWQFCARICAPGSGCRSLD